MSRLALGTVQFGLKYGVANESGQVSAPQIAAILERARSCGLDTLDTAIGYGESESRLGEAGIAGWHVVTKLPPLPAGTVSVAEWVESQVAASMRRLRVEGLDGLLLHRPADLLGPAGSSYVAALQSLRDRGQMRALGFSIYDPAELESLWPVCRPDLVQAPCNVLDRRLIHTGWLQRLSASGVRVHARSVFLQGLLLMDAARRLDAFARWRPLLDRWLGWCADNRTTPLQAALSFVLAQSGVERVVVGVDSAAHLEQILAASEVSVPLPPADLFCNDRDLIEPARWKLT
jgi:aryl-alcohol dehydrogenase-like predicted oxidoreductase